MDNEKLNIRLLTACARVLRPLIKILLRHGIGFNAFSDLAKTVYIDVARSDFALPGKRQTASRISTMTGLSRKEVSRIMQLPEMEKQLEAVMINRAARVISGWVTDKNYADEQGEPLDLSFDDDGPSFTALVKQYSGDITARTIADELMRVGAISVTTSGKIRLMQRAYVPSGDQMQKISMIGGDVADLIQTMDHNLQNLQPPFFQRKVSYSNIDKDSADNIKQLLGNSAQQCLEQMQDLILQNATSGKSKQSVRMGVGVYYFEQEGEVDNP